MYLTLLNLTVISLYFLMYICTYETSSKRAVETTDVTKSFGWDSSEGMHKSTCINSVMYVTAYSPDVFLFFLDFDCQ